MKLTHISSQVDQCWLEETTPLEQTSKTIKNSLELTGEKAQDVLGFGGCFNELGWDALHKTTNEERNDFLKDLFSPDSCNFNYGRIPIGANDFSLEWYSCDEVDGDYELEHFNIQRDKKFTIPYIQEAQKLQDNFTLFASPWSPPTWMKTKKAYNFGRMRMEDKVLSSYANYFVKFVEAYKEENIQISQVHIQNEPMADQKFPSCLWSGEDMRDFIKDYIGPAFEKSTLDTEIWLGTINGPFVDFMMPGYSAPFSEFYDQWANTVLSDEDAYKYISGVGLQWGGKHVMQAITDSYPDLRYMQTESECGDGQNTWEHLEYIFNQMWFYFRNGAERYTYWNMALEVGGISTWGWTQNSLCTIDPKTKELKRQPEFYLMKHFSKFVKPGSKLLRTKGTFSSNTVAFETPDGAIVLVVGSNMNNDRVFTFSYQGHSFTCNIKAHSLHTFILE